MQLLSSVSACIICCRHLIGQLVKLTESSIVAPLISSSTQRTAPKCSPPTPFTPPRCVGKNTLNTLHLLHVQHEVQISSRKSLEFKEQQLMKSKPEEVGCQGDNLSSLISN